MVTDVEPDSTGVTVTTVSTADCADGGRGVPTAGAPSRTERFDAVAITTGAWTAQFQADHGFGITARRLPATWYAPDDPLMFGPNRFPVCIRTFQDVEYSGFPCVDGWSVKIMPPVFPGTETVAEDIPRAVTPADTAYTRSIVERLLVGLKPKPVRTGVFMDGFAATDEPIIDSAPDSDRIVGAVGFAGHGFKMSPAVGEILTDLIGTGLNTAPPVNPASDRGRESLSAEPFRRPTKKEA